MNRTHCVVLCLAGLAWALAVASQPTRGEPVPRRGRGTVRLSRTQPVIYLQDREPGIPLVPAAAPDGELPLDPTTADELPPDVLPEPGLDPAGEAVRIPLTSPEADGDVEIQSSGDLVTLIARDAPLNSVISLLAEHHGLNVVCAENITARVSITLTDVDLEDALTSILSVAGYGWARRNNIILVTDLSTTSRLPGNVQGKRLRVFELDFVNAVDASVTVTGLLSPIGKSYTTEIAIDDNRKTREAIVVEDLPEVLETVARFLAEIDQPPRQVMIEARVLRVDLKRENKHGVNWDYLFNQGRDIKLSAVGFANPAAPQAFFASIDGNHLDALVECLETTTDAKTLAAPKVLVVNGQEAKFQVGGQLGFRVTTTTQTSTMQSVNFLDVGVVLKVTPYISKDNQVLMHVRPEVSTGKINPDTELPESETTVVETDTLLGDGQGMVIGGLIDEKDRNLQSKIPILGDLWLVGRLFQKGTLIRERSEVIIILVPRIVPYGPEAQDLEMLEYDRATTPLFHGPLCPLPREYEPKLPDPVTNPRTIFGKSLAKKRKALARN